MKDFAKILTVLVLLLIVAVSVYRYTLTKRTIAEDTEQIAKQSGSNENNDTDENTTSSEKTFQENENSGLVAGNSVMEETVNDPNADGIVSGSPHVQKNANNNDQNQNNESSQVNNSQGDIMAKKLTPEDKIKFPPPEGIIIDTSKTYTATLNTEKGDIKVKLHTDKVPTTANNFVYLAQNRFYDDVIFHRVVKNFMIQSGDPLGNGMGGPNYRFNDEEFEGEYKRGTLAMANSGPNTNGSQFFIMHKDTPLPPNYVIFGEVIEGLDVVDVIGEAEVRQSPSGEMSDPIDPVVIKTVTIEIE